MKPSTKRKLTTAIRQYRDTFLDKSQDIAMQMEYGWEIDAGKKRAFIEAAHKHKVAKNFNDIMEGE